MVIASTWRGYGAIAQPPLPASPTPLTPAAVSPSPAPNASPPITPLRVAIKIAPPFVLAPAPDRPRKGYSIELWDQVATTLQRPYDYVDVESVDDLLEAVATGQADVGIAAVTMTAQREKQVDFSHSYYQSGLQILHRNSGTGIATGVMQLLGSTEVYYALGGVIVYSLLSAHLVWWFERRHNSEMFPAQYWAGITEALWWSLVTATTVGYGDKAPITPVGRIVATAWMFWGLVIVAYFTASLTVDRLSSQVESLSDLHGNPVGVVENTTADRFMEQEPVKLRRFDTLEQAIAAVMDDKIMAVVGDAPLLRYQATKFDQLHVAPHILSHENYAIVLPIDSPFREDINRTILMLQDSGALTRLEQRWFPATD